jgi:hypothetical protein
LYCPIIIDLIFDNGLSIAAAVAAAAAMMGESERKVLFVAFVVC